MVSMFQAAAGPDRRAMFPFVLADFGDGGIESLGKNQYLKYRLNPQGLDFEGRGAKRLF